MSKVFFMLSYQSSKNAVDNAIKSLWIKASASWSTPVYIKAPVCMNFVDLPVWCFWFARQLLQTTFLDSRMSSFPPWSAPHYLRTDFSFFLFPFYVVPWGSRCSSVANCYYSSFCRCKCSISTVSTASVLGTLERIGPEELFFSGTWGTGESLGWAVR